MSVPVELRTARLLLRPWRSDDAAALHPILEANWAHLGPWIPARIATPAPIPVLAERLDGFAADFAADREWRYALVSSEDDAVLGATKLLEPGQKESLKLTAPADEGEYDYVCTYPEHWQVMWGKLIVTKDVDGYVKSHPENATSNAGDAAHGHHR